jgi:putative endonuclease
MEGTVYLLHFLEPIGNPTNPHAMAQHYLGVDLTGRRIQVQTAGAGAAIVRYVQAQGIGFVVAATWPGGRALERQLKRRKHASRFCPICRTARAKGR